MHTENPLPAADSRRSRGPLAVAGECFRLLLAGPAPLSVDGREFPGLPARPVPLNELRNRLLSGRCPRRTRDRVWTHLIGRARGDGPAWTVACVGMALPALAAVADYLTEHLPARGRSGDRVEVQAEVLAGFLAALPTVDLDRPGIAGRLRWAAYRSGRAALSAALDGPTRGPDGYRSAAPRPPSGHPDFVLAHAVRHRVITRVEADLIGATRLEDVRLTDWAAAHRLDSWAAYKMRARAEIRLVGYLSATGAGTDPDDPVPAQAVANLTLEPAPARAPRPTLLSPAVTGPGPPTPRNPRATPQRSNADGP